MILPYRDHQLCPAKKEWLEVVFYFSVITDYFLQSKTNSPTAIRFMQYGIDLKVFALLVQVSISNIAIVKLVFFSKMLVVPQMSTIYEKNIGKN